MTAEYELLKFVQRLANATEYASYDTGHVIEIAWKNEAIEILDRHHLMVSKQQAWED